MSVSKRIVLMIILVCSYCLAQPANLVMESAEELDGIQFRLSRILEGDGIDKTNRSLLIEKLRGLKGPIASNCALALSFLPPDKLTVNELEVGVSQGDDLVSLYSAWALLRMGETAWVEKGVERLGRFQYPPGKINFGLYLTIAGRYDGWPDVAAALKDPKSGGAEFSAALVSLNRYAKMRGGAGAAVDYAELLDGIQSEAVKSGIAAKRLEMLQVEIQAIKSREKRP